MCFLRLTRRFVDPSKWVTGVSVSITREECDQVVALGIECPAALPRAAAKLQWISDEAAVVSKTKTCLTGCAVEAIRSGMTLLKALSE